METISYIREETPQISVSSYKNLMTVMVGLDGKTGWPSNDGDK
jgi:hypothetical protein